jgi:hypothetical protein
MMAVMVSTFQQSTALTTWIIQMDNPEGEGPALPNYQDRVPVLIPEPKP